MMSILNIITMHIENPSQKLQNPYKEQDNQRYKCYNYDNCIFENGYRISKLFIEMWFCTIIDMFLDFKTSYVVYYLQLIRSFLCVILDYKIEKEKRIPIKLLRFLFITSSAYITNQMYFCCPKNILQLSNFNMYF